MICTYCGAPLVKLISTSTTVRVAEPSSKPKPPDRVVELTRLYTDIVVFQIAGHEQPLLVKAPSGGRVSIGRYNPGEIAPSVDLTPYNGSLMGVSRQHAIITREENMFALQDLGSTNGTWLNEVKLVPNQSYEMRSGDSIRLGQIMMVIYFRTPNATTELEETIHLMREFDSELRGKLSLRDLDNLVMPYLKAIAGLQGVCNDILNQPQLDVAISNISLEPGKSLINVTLVGAQGVIKLLRGSVVRWREMHSEKIAYLHQKELVGGDLGLPSPNGKTGEYRKELRDAGVELAHDILAEVAPLLNSDQRKLHAAKVLTHLQTLALSPLRVTSGD